MERVLAENFNEVFSIMEESFPINEYRSYKKQMELLSVPEYSLYCKRIDGKIAGFLSFWDLNEVIFIEHFAIKKELRGKGLGKEMLSELFAEKSGPFCLEVELPENEVARRRVAFYERMGLFFYDYPYTQPSMDHGRDPIPLRIMTNIPSLSKERFETLRDLLYKCVYKVI
ncbi:MAG: GNAT family N-acetyltransferase [Clostridia bacterium]|nr:GNAT family N-acetyltransferase [Clostridia bacterium]